MLVGVELRVPVGVAPEAGEVVGQQKVEAKNLMQKRNILS